MDKNTKHITKHTFDDLLKSRIFIPANDDLAQRIILAAKSSIPQNKILDESLWQWLNRLFSYFIIPQPVYVLVFILAVGLIIGFNIPISKTVYTYYIQDFLYLKTIML